MSTGSERTSRSRVLTEFFSPFQGCFSAGAFQRLVWVASHGPFVTCVHNYLAVSVVCVHGLTPATLIAEGTGNFYVVSTKTFKYHWSQGCPYPGGTLSLLGAVKVGGQTGSQKEKDHIHRVFHRWQNFWTREVCFLKMSAQCQSKISIHSLNQSDDCL